MKKQLQTYLFTALIACFGLLASFQAQATHIFGMDLRYSHVTGLTYRITLTVYGDCAPSGASSFATLPSASPKVCIYNGTTNVGNVDLTIQAPSAGVEVTPVCLTDTGRTQCTSSSFTTPGVKKFVYSGTYTLPSTSAVWRFVYNGYLGTSGGSAGRSATITNINAPGSSVIALIDTLNNTTRQNTSPDLTVLPTPFFCAGQNDTYNPGAVDADGDSLRFSLVDGAVGAGAAGCSLSSGNVTYISGQSATNPIQLSGGFSFDPATGQINFVPIIQRALVVYNVREFSGGTLIGTSQREMTVLALSCTTPPPTGAISNPTNGTVVDTVNFLGCRNTGVTSFEIRPYATDTTNTINVSTSGLPSGATFTTVNNGTNHPICTFSWNTTGVAVGSYTFYVTYLDNACPLSGTQTKSYTVTISEPPTVNAITGPNTVCTGGNITLANTTPGGTWSSVFGHVFVSTAGVATGISTGVDTVKYTVTNSCGSAVATYVVTVNLTADAGTISGPTTICIGATGTFTNTVTGGTWSNAFTTVSNISTGGVVTPVAPGVDTIKYTVTNTCGTAIARKVVTILPDGTPGTLSGPSTVCVGSTITVASTITGGTWSSVFTSIATVVPTTGVVRGVATGVDTLKYTVSNSCGTGVATKVITVNPQPVPGTISGPDSVCQGLTITLTSSATGGSWSSVFPSIATVGATTGIVTGVVGGIDTIKYSVTNTCGTLSASKVVVVKSLPSIPSITGPTEVCAGSTITLSNTLPGGTWSSSNTAVATVATTTGVVRGVTGGVVTITYSASNSCGTTGAIYNVTVSTTPISGVISGATSVCVGAITTFTTTGTGGTWSSVFPALATVTATGIITGVSNGIDTIKYTVTNACGTAVSAKDITIINAANAGTLSGSATVCQGATTTLTSTVTGGTWSNVFATIATVNSAGVVTGVTPGVDTIKYTVVNACGSATATKVITVLATPNAGTISGAPTVCTGVTTTLTTTGIGGTWSSVFPSIATIGAATGIATGVSVGVDTIKYTVTNTCGTSVATHVLTVNLSANAGTISGPTSVCTGNTITLTTTGVGGTWSSILPSLATVTSSGVVTGVAVGIDTIKYTVTNTCGTSVAAYAVTVNTVPVVGAISGPTVVCAGSTITLTNATTGGNWTSQTPSIATVGATGIVTGVTAGIDTIIYTVTNGCGTSSSRVGITVNPLAVPGTISGPTAVCVGSTISLTTTGTGGTWISSNTSLATVNALGVVTGVAAGTDTILYAVTNSCGTVTANHIVTINALPFSGTISGAPTVCVGATTTLATTGTGGTWSSQTPSLATINASGVVTGVAGGVDTIKYTVINTCGTAVSSYAINVAPLPTIGAISGPSTVCVASTIALTDTTAGGVWTSSNNAIATVDATGTVTGVSAGAVTISYAVTNACGVTTVIKNITVNALPAAGTISGSNFVCIGSAVTLTSTTTGGTWSSSNTAVATVNATSGLVGGVAAGVSRIVYSVTNTCGTDTIGITMSVNSTVPSGTITGPTVVCTGNTITLTPSVTGGTWSSSNTTVATVNTAGVVRGVSAGTVNISYAISSSCGTSITTYAVTVNLSPNAGVISGANTVCTGTTTTLTTTGTGGTWSSSDGAVATVGSTTGIVTGVSVGAVVISYSVTNTCGTATATKNMTVNLTADAGTLTGPTTVCAGSTINLTNSVTGGTWTSGSTAIATVDASGLVTGVSGGTTTISYTVTTACGTASATSPLTVTPAPNAGTIGGVTSICTGATSTLTTTGTGGTWSSNNTAIATVNPTTGVVTGVANGTATISYTVTNACGTAFATANVTVNTSPTAGTISGPTSVCTANTITLTSTVTGGTWSSGNTAIATVTAGTGIVRGNSAGTVTISYIVTTSCGSAIATYSVTVGTAPSAGTISGARIVCIGNNINLTTTGTGGTWSSSDAGIASVNTTGTVTGIGSGAAIISYTVSASCGTVSDTQLVNVSPAPDAGTISGPNTVCVGSTTTLATTGTGGTWTSGTTAVATVNSTGVVTGVSTGSTIISYTATTACGTATSTYTVSVNTTVSAGTLSGPTVVCVGNNITLSSTVTGGTWTSTDATVATVNSTTGVVTGVASGSANISYTVTNGCGTAAVGQAVTVSPAPNAGTISGPTTVCAGNTISLSETVTGGTWSSSNGAIATVSATGTVTGVTAGSVIISYTATSGCGSVSDTQAVTVNPIPAAGTISGPTAVCIGSNITLTTTGTGGTWSSSNAAVATVVPTTGVVTGLAIGAIAISYTVTNSCGTSISTYTINVGAAPNAGTITGPNAVCVTSTINLSTTGTGGTWSSSNPAAATVNATGVVTGVASGTTIISYTATTSCGTATDTAEVTVNPGATAGTLSGPTAVCIGATITQSSTISGGVWSSSNTSVATVNAATGVVTGVAAGTTTISYVVSGSCGSSTASRNITVSPAPATGTLSGPASVCVGNNITWTSTVTGGTWSSSNPAVATVHPTTGIVSGLSAGTVTISYTAVTACAFASATGTVTVNTSVSAGTLSGASSVCQGATTTWSSTITGGTWTSSNTAIATVDATTGVITGVSAGAATISYAVTNGCGTATTSGSITVTPAAVAGTISGPTNICIGSTGGFTASVGGGVWSTSNAALATISSTGTVTGLSAGTVIISYTVTGSCGPVSTTASLLINAFPNAGTISGPGNVCIGGTGTYIDTVSGGVWSTGDTTIATISSTGVVTGVRAGTVNIYYSVTNSCGATNVTVSINVIASGGAGTISGPTAVCTGNTITLSETLSGGTWSSANTAVATVNPTTGVVTGVASGTTAISYTITTSCGTVSTTHTVTVTPAPTPGTITGATTLCVGNTTVLFPSISGGSWTSGDASLATVSATGVVTGVASGTVTISYGITGTCGTSYATHNITINNVADAGTISGGTSICVSNTTSLSSTVSGGTWSSSNTSVATVSAAGSVFGVSAGTATISYGVTNSCGTNYATATVTVSTTPTPGFITGATSLCAGTTSTYTESVTGGIWSSSTPAIATVSATGDVTAVSAGSVLISYSVSNGCGFAVATAAVTVSPLPNAGTLTGPTSVCLSSTITLTPSVSGGSWSSATTSVATVNSAGVVTPVTAGTSVISYTVTNSCGSSSATATVTVNALADAGVIIGGTTICAGTTATLTTTGTGGTWSSADTTIATVSSTGVVTGVGSGTVLISYSALSSCGLSVATANMTINPLPTVGTLSGASVVCMGSSTSLTASVTGGIWSSSDTARATVSTTGVVTGISAGSVTISYTITNSCGSRSATHNMNIETMPTTAGTITGATFVCAASTTTLTNTLTTGTWSSSDASVATISAAGVVTGVSAGTAIMSYTVSNSCGSVSDTMAFTVLGTGSAGAIIAATTTVCVGNTISVSSATTGGVWSSSDASIARIDSTGTISGIAAGTAVVSYTVITACGTATSTVNIDVNPTPFAGVVSGPTHQCVGTTITLTSTGTSGVWSSASAAIATVDTTGVVTGVSAGITTISYTVTNIFGCTDVATSTDTVFGTTSAGAITGGGTAVCAGSTITLSDSVAGGTWSSADTTIASVSSTGVVTARAAGSTLISYTVSGGSCSSSATVVVDVNPTPAMSTISGATTLCTTTSTTLSTTGTGGVWSSSDTTVANITSGGVVTGVTAGTVNISYTITNIFGCQSIATHTITLGTLPTVASVVGTSALCAGTTATYTDSTAGGRWSTSDTTLATISSTGLLTARTAGSVTVSYTVGTGCTATATRTVTINAAPSVSAITGSALYCIGASGTLVDTTSGGTWSSSNMTVATISTTGTVFALTAGTSNISYTVTSGGCSASAVLPITVSSLPTAGTISGPASLCIGSTTAYTDSIAGGTWSSSDTTVATISTTGVVTARTAGTVTITYSLVATGGCSATATRSITIYAAPTASTITGATTLCMGGSITLSTSVAGGSWTSSDTSIARVSGAGVVSGINAGMATISYTITGAGGCTATSTHMVTVDTFAIMSLLPASGVLEICHGTPVTMSVAGGRSGFTYQWFRNGVAVAGATSTSLTTDSAGIYTVLVSNGTCSVTISSVRVTMFTAPVINVATGTLLYTGTYAYYQWYLNGVAISGANSNIYNASLPGVYTIVVRSASGCVDTSAGYVVSGGGGTIVANLNAQDIKLYPNPTTSIVRIDAPLAVDVVIMSIDGKVVMEANEATSMDVSSLSSALYVIKVYNHQTKELVRTEKLIKED